MSDDNPSVFLAFSAAASPASPVVVGRVVVELFSSVAPGAVDSILGAAMPNASGFSLVGSTIRKVLPGLFCELCMPGIGSFGVECVPKGNKHIRGSVSICRKGPLPSQVQPTFMICFAALPSLDGHHVVIGQVTEGLETLCKLERFGSLPLGECSHHLVVSECGQVVDEDDDDGV